MKNILDYIFVEPFPSTWLIQDIIALLLSLFVLAFIIKRNRHPVILILEAFAFVFPLCIDLRKCSHCHGSVFLRQVARDDWFCPALRFP